MNGCTALATSSQREVIIYATLSTNVLQYVTHITDTNWQDGCEVIQTNLTERFRAVATNRATIYLRSQIPVSFIFAILSNPAAHVNFQTSGD